MEEPRGLDWPTMRTVDALENIAAELERLRVLKEYELGVEIQGPDPYVVPVERGEG
jgi:hypothetical protein